jgi:hypothetical protein
MIVRAGRRIVDHLGWVGLIALWFIIPFTVRFWGHKTSDVIIVWVVWYVMSRMVRDGQKRREAARRALDKVWGKLNYEEAETIRKGLQ